MNVKEARRLWGSNVPQDILEEWVRIYNLQREKIVEDDAQFPKNETSEGTLSEPQEFRCVPSDQTHDVRHG